MAKLVMLTDSGTDIFTLNEGENILGRSSKAGISIQDKKVSREHARVIFDNNMFFVEDLQSSNGTFVNGKRIEKEQVKDGDRIRIGKTELVFNDDDNDPLVGKVLKGYEIKFRLGQGSMGSVYLANQLTMDRNVAIKVLKKELASDEEFVRRFEQEAKLAGKLNHKNVIGAHDFGEVDGQYFFSMEFVKGENLQQIIDREGAFPFERCLEYSLQIARGLEHAHRLGIIHQDIKPLNIIIGDNNVIKIADLGLAKNMRLIDPTDQKNMRIMGTPQYIAPEVLKKKIPDGKSDIYSLGATMFHMATGRPCFMGSDVMDIVKQRLDFPTPEPDKINSKINKNFSNLILKLMEISPENRPSDISEVISLLEKVSEGGSVDRHNTPPLESLSPVADDLEPEEEPVSPKRSRKRPVNSQASLEAKKKNKRMAMLIVYLISVGVAAVLAGVLYQFLKPDPEEEARKHYEKAKEFIEVDNDGEAESYLQFSLEQYPEASVNPEIKKLLGYIERKRQLSTYAMQYKKHTLDSKAMHDVLNNFINRESNESLKAKAKALLAVIPEPVKEAEEITSSENVSAENLNTTDNEWVSIKREVQKNIDSENYKDAQSLLYNYMGEYPDTAESNEAQEILDNISTKVNEKFNQKISEIKKNYGNDKVALWNELEKMFFETENISNKEKMHKELLKISVEARSEIKKLYQQVDKSLLSLDMQSVLRNMTALEQRFDGLQYLQDVTNMQEIIKMASQYSSVLKRKISSGDIIKISVAGIPGELRLTLNSENNPAVRLGEELRQVKWPDIYDSALWDIAPANELNDEQNIGAALHFMARGHWGFSRTYLGAVKSDIPAIKYIAAQVRARKDGRDISDYLTFSSYNEIKRWQQIEGVCNFDKGFLDCSGTGFFSAGLKGKLYNLKDLAVNMEVRRNDNKGIFKLILDTYGKGKLIIALSESGSSIYFEKAIVVSETDEEGLVSNILESSGRSLGNQAVFKVSVEGGKVILSSGREEICNLDAGINEDIYARLYIEFEEVSGKIGDMIIAEGQR